MKDNEILNENLKANNKYLREESRSRRMTTMELIERGIGHNCLADAYDLGRADAIDEIMELKGKHCDSCSMQNICGNDCLKNILEGLKRKSNGEE